MRPDVVPETSMRVPVGVPVIGAVVVLLVLALRLDPPGSVIGFIAFAVVAPVQLWIDLRTHRLPRRVSYAGALVGFVSLAVVAMVLDQTERIIDMVLGAVVVTAVLAIVYLIGRVAGGAVGRGDLFLAPFLGVHLGWFGVGAAVVGVAVGFLLAAIASVVLLVGRRVGWGDEIAFGPPLLLGALATMVAVA